MTDRKEIYHKVIEVVRDNTAGPAVQLPAGMREGPLKQNLCNLQGHEVDAVDTAIQAAVANDDLLPWRDRDGRLRFTATDEASLRDLIGTENSRDHPDRELIEQAATHIHE